MSSPRRAPPPPRAQQRVTRPLLGLLGLGFALLSLACLERRPQVDESDDVGRCATCHGDPSRSGDVVQRAAPPRDLSGGNDPSFPGVGSHQLHLQPSADHAAFACSECHVVPERVDSPGHADHGSPARLVFGALASSDNHVPRYDTGTRTCSDSYCHGTTHAVWNAPRSSTAACGSCHGLPPPLPHPQSDRCSVCHGDVIDAQNHFIAPGLHVNGSVEYTPGACSACHGSGDDPAPPRDTQGNTSVSALGVGAHQAHLTSTLGRSLACKECHQVPRQVDDPGHILGLPARVALNGIATTDDRSPTWHEAQQTCADTYCHSPTKGSTGPSPRWTAPVTLGCTSCHGAPPALPHPQSSQCSVCHALTVGADNQTIIDRERHIDGVVDVSASAPCNACHGGVNPAPPRDLAGSTATSASGVGAHQTHVLGTARSRKVSCNECHVVPATLLAMGHLDSDRPAEVVFSGVAAVSAGAPTYRGGSCQNTGCHGASLPSGNDGGGSLTSPSWTKVDGSQASCGSCHGLPPPPPHPYGALNPVCSACHEDIAPDNASFVRPELHVDGIVTFKVP